MVIHRNRWQYMVINDNKWCFMVIHEIHSNTWEYLAIYGYKWQYMVIHGYSWQYMVIHRYTWLYTAIHGNTWQHMVSVKQFNLSKSRTVQHFMSKSLNLTGERMLRVLVLIPGTEALSLQECRNLWRFRQDCWYRISVCNIVKVGVCICLY